jgi:Uncharacterised nucleotidyltransferase
MLSEFETVTHLAAGERGIPCNLPLISLDEKKLDVKKLITLAHEHKLTNCLLSAIKSASLKRESTSKKLCLTPEDQKIFENYKKTALLEKTSRTFMVEEALHICRTLHNSHLPAIILKGPILSLQLYGSPTVREYTDIDIVVDTQNFFKVDKGMQTLGYCADPESQVKQFNHEKKRHHFSQKSCLQKSYIQKPHHIVYKNPSHPYRIEIHTEIFKSQLFNRELFPGNNFPEKYSLQNIFSRAEILHYRDSAYRAIDKTDHLLFMIAHGTKHAWSQLHWVLDAAALLADQDSSLHSEIVKGCVELYLEKHLVLMIAVVTELLPISIPSAYRELAAQHQKSLKKQKNIALKMLRSPNTIRPSILHTLHFTWSYTAPLALTMKEKINIILNPFKASPADIERLHLPEWLAPLHILARPFFVLSRQVRGDR